jgi:hypothetical protein
MGYYSAALSATPLGAPRQAREPWSLGAAVEIGYIPWLSRERRTAGFDKPEASNLSPVLPRPHLEVELPGGVALDVHWVPPVKVRDARANLLGGSLQKSFNIGALAVAPRVSVLSGRIEGAITCFEELGSGSLSDIQYYANVCHASESRDWFEPSHLAFDVGVGSGSGLVVFGAHPFLAGGVRRESARFDIGVILPDGSRDPDHPVLEMSATRAYATAGLEWRVGARSRYTAELFWSPGSLFTARFLGAWRLR